MPKLSIHHHENQIESNEHSNISFCADCSSIIITTETKSTLSTVKPTSFQLPTDIDPSLILSHEDSLTRFFSNKKEYLNVRQKVIREMKKIKSKNSLSYQTFFLGVTYLDLICSKLSSFNYDEISLIAHFCIIIAAKFSEDGYKAYEIEKEYRKTISSNYHSDEVYILKLLDYNLNIITSYEMMITIMRIGFLFEDEVFNKKKMNFVYNQMEKMLYAFVESRKYIDMTQKEIAMGIVGFSRESLGLEAYGERVKVAFGFNDSEYKLSFYMNGLSKVKMCLKIKKESTKEIITKMANSLMNNNKIMYSM